MAHDAIRRPPTGGCDSADRMLRRAEVFDALGDRDVVGQCIRLAERLAADDRDGAALERVYAFARGLAARSAATEAAQATWP